MMHNNKSASYKWQVNGKGKTNSQHDAWTESELEGTKPSLNGVQNKQGAAQRNTNRRNVSLIDTLHAVGSVNRWPWAQGLRYIWTAIQQLRD